MCNESNTENRVPIERNISFSRAFLRLLKIKLKEHNSMHHLLYVLHVSDAVLLVLYCTVLYCIVLYCTVLYCTVLYCTVSVRVSNVPAYWDEYYQIIFANHWTRWAS